MPTNWLNQWRLIVNVTWMPHQTLSELICFKQEHAPGVTIYTVTAILIQDINPRDWSQFTINRHHISRDIDNRALFQYLIRRFAIRSHKSRSCKIDSLNYRIALRFDKHINSTAAKVSVKFQSDRANLYTNLIPSRLGEILQYVLSNIKTRPAQFARSWVDFERIG